MWFTRNGTERITLQWGGDRKPFIERTDSRSSSISKVKSVLELLLCLNGVTYNQHEVNYVLGRVRVNNSIVDFYHFTYLKQVLTHTYLFCSITFTVTPE